MLGCFVAARQDWAMHWRNVWTASTSVSNLSPQPTPDPCHPPPARTRPLRKPPPPTPTLRADNNDAKYNGASHPKARGGLPQDTTRGNAPRMKHVRLGAVHTRATMQSSPGQAPKTVKRARLTSLIALAAARVALVRIQPGRWGSAGCHEGAKQTGGRAQKPPSEGARQGR